VSWPPDTTPSPGQQPSSPAADPDPGAPSPPPDAPDAYGPAAGARPDAPDAYGSPAGGPYPGQFGGYAGGPAGAYGGPGEVGGPYGGPGEVAGAYGPPGGAPTPAGYGLPPERTRVRLWPPSRREWTTALGTIAALAVLGAALAPLWVHLAPRLAFRVSTPGTALPVVPEAEEYVAADGRFVIITLIVGVLGAVGCWLVKRSRGPWTLLALAVGGLLGAVVTWRLGLRLGTGYKQEDLRVVGRVIYPPLTLRATAALVVEPVAAVIVYLLATGFSARNDLGRGDGPDDETGATAPLSSDSG
jgi:hypothetical protein